ncbi:hypothetical protein [Nonomuraea sp. NPDC046570]|uniref:hypothetical protein n=1 Tax=Nonomuraea sp. NPDC046570 TaxID=3155255 RepID=UPI0033F204D3
MTTPAGPGLVRAVAAEAAAKVRSLGAGDAVPDPRGLLPATDEAEPLVLSRVPAALTAKLKNLVGDGPSLTYRLCAESATQPAACSAARPLAVPVQADVTGDGTPDLVADLVPRKQEQGVGVGLASMRLPGSETRGGALKAQIWAEYELPGGKKLTVGFDGYRRGSSLSGTDWGVFTLDPATKDVTVSMKRTDPAAAVATVAGLDGTTLLSLRQSPAAERFTAHAALGGQGSGLTVTSSRPAALDALLVTDRRRLTHVRVNGLRTRMTAELTRRGGVTDLHLTSPGPIPSAAFRDHVYEDGRLARLTALDIRGLPRDFRARHTAERGAQALTMTSASPRAKSADLLYFAEGTVVKARLDDLPARVRLENDPAANRVTHTASGPIGAFEITLQRNGGAISAPPGDHITMIKDGPALGVSGRLSAVAGFDVTYGATPRVRLNLGSGGHPFLGAASIDRTHLARLEISNTPARLSADLDPAARTATYRATETISRLRAAYADLKEGPIIQGTLYGVRSTVAASWNLGTRSSVEVAAGSRLKRIDLRAAKGDDQVSADVEGLRERAALVVDAAAEHLAWTSGGEVDSVSASARTRLDGRDLRAAAVATGVPARFDASWAGGAPGFRGLSGPIASARIAVANHPGAQAPKGPHLAVHHDAASGDFDASARIDGLREAALTPAGGGFTAEVRAARQRVALDADLRLAGDLRYGVLGTLGPVPGRVTITAKDGLVAYDSGGARLDLKARLWLGKGAALDSIAHTPHLPGGLTLVDAPCRGCAPATGPFCTAARGCFGVKGFVDLTGLPHRVTIDPAKKTFTFTGYRPAGRKLGLYLDSRVLAPVPVRARATLTGLPERVTSLTVGPFDAGKGRDVDGRDSHAVTANYTVEPAATIGSLDVRAEADTPGYGRVRGRVVVSPVPATVAVNGNYGRKTRITVRNATPVRRLEAAVTVLPEGAGRAGSGLLRFTGVPSVFGIDTDGAGSGLRLPALAYQANASTLDGLLAVEGALIEKVYKPRRGELLGTSLAVTDLAARTTATVRPDLSVELVSTPVPTRRIEVHAGLSLEPVARQKVSAAQEVPHAAGLLGYRLGGEFGLDGSRIEDLSLAVHRLSWLRVRPGRVPFGLAAPKAVGFLTPGFEGGYDRIDLRARGVDLRPDVRLDIRVSRKVGADVFRQSVRVGPTRSLELRRYDQRLRPISGKQAIKAGDVPLACLTVAARPGYVPVRARDSITLRGADGPQTISLLDAGAQVPGYAVDLLTHFMSPFPGADWKVSALDPGSCG